MRDRLLAETATRHGVITRAQALAVAPHYVLDGAVAARALLRQHPQVYLLSELMNDDATLDRAAVVYTDGVLSHLSALRRHGLHEQPPRAIRHVTRTPDRQLRGNPEVVVHRRRLVRSLLRGDLPVVPLEQAIIESWPLLRASERRGVSITAVSDGRTTGRRLMSTVLATPTTPGAAAMRSLFSLLADGCRSELELWGHGRVFDRRELADAVLQHPVRTRAGVYVLDRAHLREQVGVELDGAAWHGSRQQRERDVRRDAALAAMGWLVVRFTHSRLHADPEGCACDLIAILAARRQQIPCA